MINTSDSILWLTADGLQRAKSVLREIETLSAQKANYKGRPLKEVHNRQLRRRLALTILRDNMHWESLNIHDFNNLYKITACSVDDTQSLRHLYEVLTGFEPAYIDDVIGLRAPMRAVFAVLWTEKIITLPHTFRLDGVHQRFPELDGKTQGFLYHLTKNSDALLRASRSYQYRTNWHSLSDIQFVDLWESAPLVVDTKRSISANGGHLEFAYLPTIKHISELYPNIISPDQFFHLEKYHQHLQSKPRSVSAVENRVEFSDFRKLWGADSDAWKEMTKKEREHLRYENRTKHLHENMKAQARDNKHAASLEHLASKLSAWDNPAEVALLLRQNVRRDYKDFSWLQNGCYPGITTETIDIHAASKHWIAGVNLYYDFLNNKSKGIGKKHRSKYLADIAFMMDYLFCYIPLWRKNNPGTLVEVPYFLSEFQRIIFWNNDFVSDEFCTPNLDHGNGICEKMPLTLLQFYALKYSKKTTASFIKSIFTFFDVAITSGRRLIVEGEDFNDGNLVNPVAPKLDSPGCGGRSKSDKIVLPLSAVPVAEAYLLAIDHIGQQIQEHALSGKISAETLDTLRRKDWIDLHDLNIVYNLELVNPNTGEIHHSIPLDKIINAYNWHLGSYGSDKNLKWMPWLSSNRMLLIALFGGLRMQNAQWLDIRSFDRFHSAKNTTLGYTSLYVNTDKNGASRPVTLEVSVFECLESERRFQNRWTRRPVGPVNYEDNKHDKRYGPIYPLFRSPHSKKGLPFSDKSYATKWVEILKGVQSIYNSLVPEGQRHEFVRTNQNGNLVAVHTAHSLRATWITYKTIYGHLSLAITGQQVAHGNPRTSLYYNVPTQDQLIEQVRLANKKVSAASWSELWGQGTQTNTINAMQDDLRSDYKAAIGIHGLVNIGNSFIETKDNAFDLIPVTDVTKIGWNLTCACMLNGHCPIELLNFTKTPKICGICPYAVFGIIHLPAINAKMRALIDKCESFGQRIVKVENKLTATAEIQHLHQQLTVNKLELAGYQQVQQILQKNLESKTFINKYITRHGEFRQRSKEIDYNDNTQRLIANIVDGELYPAFASDNYLLRLKKIASSPKLLEIALAEPDEKELIANQIIFMLANTDISMAELAQRIERSGKLGIAHPS